MSFPATGPSSDATQNTTSWQIDHRKEMQQMLVAHQSRLESLILQSEQRVAARLHDLSETILQSSDRGYFQPPSPNSKKDLDLDKAAHHQGTVPFHNKSTSNQMSAVPPDILSSSSSKKVEVKDQDLDCMELPGAIVEQKEEIGLSAMLAAREGGKKSLANAREKLRTLTGLKNEVEDVSHDRVCELFSHLPQNSDGSISVVVLLSQLPNLIPDVARRERFIGALEIINDQGSQRGKGTITEKEFSQALRIDTDDELEKLKKKIAKGVEDEDRCQQAKLVQYLQERKETAANCFSLPCNLLFFMVTCLLVTLHLHISDANNQNAAMHGVTRVNPLKVPQSSDHFWEWTEDSLVPVVFGSHGRVASYNQVVGGLLISRDAADVGPCHQSELQGIYSDEDGPCRSSHVVHSSHWLPLSANGTLQSLTALREAGWVSSATEMVKVSLLSYNAENNLYTLLHTYFHIQASGRWKVIQEYDSFDASPYDPIGYPASLLIFLDSIFGVILLYMLYEEIAELWRAYRIKWSLKWTFKRYLGFWNAVDWFKLVVSFIVCIWWGLIVHHTHLLNDLVLQLAPHTDPTHIDTARSIHEEALHLRQLHRNFLLLLVAFGGSIILMFFKAFRANPRLNLVTRTIVVATRDLLHFGIVFFSIFLAFVLMGHLIFGLATPEFATLDKSIDTTFLMLTGLLDPQILMTNFKFSGALWVNASTIVMQLILLNMVLVIVFDVYAEVKQGIGDAPTIWQQAWDSFREKQSSMMKVKELQMASQGLNASGRLVSSVIRKSVEKSSQVMGALKNPRAVVPHEEAVDSHNEAKESSNASNQPGDDEAQPSIFKAHTMALGLSETGLLSETEILNCLERIEISDEEFWDADKLVDAVGESRLSREQAQVLLSSAVDYMHRKICDEDLVSLSDCCRLIGRVDANVRELIMHQHLL